MTAFIEEIEQDGCTIYAPNPVRNGTRFVRVGFMHGVSFYCAYCGSPNEKNRMDCLYCSAPRKKQSNALSDSKNRG